MTMIHVPRSKHSTCNHIGVDKEIKHMFCVCRIISSSVEKCCLKQRNGGVGQGFSISNNISTPNRFFCINHDNKYVYFISILPQQLKELIISSNRKYMREEKSGSICDVILIGKQETAEILVPYCYLVMLECRQLVFFL